VASQPPRVTWTEESFTAFQQLPFDIRREIIDKLDIVQRYPRMYQVQAAGRWRGLRRFLVQNWKIYYVYWDKTHTIYVEAIGHTRAEDRF
jgi:mRNA-degrading endonuclease RelE of RelBE toxin-antitoxin system